MALYSSQHCWEDKREEKWVCRDSEGLRSECSPKAHIPGHELRTSPEGSALSSVGAPTWWPVRPLLVSTGHDIRVPFLQGGLLQTLHIEYPIMSLLSLQAPKVYLASLEKMAPMGSLAHRGLLVILVSLDCKALQDLKVWWCRQYWAEGFCEGLRLGGESESQIWELGNVVKPDTIRKLENWVLIQPLLSLWKIRALHSWRQRIVLNPFLDSLPDPKSYDYVL